MNKPIKTHKNHSLRVALLTGASRGLGASILKNLVSKGYYVCGTATTEKSAKSITTTIENLGGNGCGLVLKYGVDDMSDFVKKLIDAHGVPSIFVNNAGITHDNLILRMTNEEWDKVIEVNLSASFRLSKAILRSMIKLRWGRIVFISSVVGLSGNAGQANYAASKAGIGGFSRSIAKEVASRGITVNCIAPGFIETDMTESLKENVKASVLNSIPLARFGKPEDIANAVSFLVSEEASYITGVTLNVDGGMFMY